MATPATQGAPKRISWVNRLFTAYLPPIWGWVTLAWMRCREYL